jgi:hypothetical protein
LATRPLLADFEDQGIGGDECVGAGVNACANRNQTKPHSRSMRMIS